MTDIEEFTENCIQAFAIGIIDLDDFINEEKKDLNEFEQILFETAQYLFFEVQDKYEKATLSELFKNISGIEAPGEEKAYVVDQKKHIQATILNQLALKRSEESEVRRIQTGIDTELYALYLVVLVYKILSNKKVPDDWFECNVDDLVEFAAFIIDSGERLVNKD